MGVMKTPDGKVRIEDLDLDNIDYRDYVFDTDSEEEVVAAEHIEPVDAKAILEAVSADEKRRKKNRQQRALRRFQRAAGRIGCDGINVKRNMGARKRRRVENAHLVLSHADVDDICEDFSDLMPETVTAFSRLFLDPSSMKTWQSFAEESDEAQERFIRQLERPGISTDDFEVVLGGTPIKPPKGYRSMTDEEKRAHHPAYSARACFNRMESRLKAALTKKRGVPHQMLDDLEHRLREFFHENPTGVWIDLVAGPHTRVYVHAIASYLSLASTSVIGDSGGKMMEIRNCRKYFIPPYGFLVPFLLQQQQQCMAFGGGDC